MARLHPGSGPRDPGPARLLDRPAHHRRQLTHLTPTLAELAQPFPSRADQDLRRWWLPMDMTLAPDAERGHGLHQAGSAGQLQLWLGEGWAEAAPPFGSGQPAQAQTPAAHQPPAH